MTASGRPAMPAFRALLPQLSGGVLAGLMIVVSSVSCAVLIFAGDLEAALPLGFGLAMVGSIVQAATVAWGSSFRFAIACPDPASAVILALIATNLSRELRPLGPAVATATVWAAILVSTLGVGLALHALGRFHLGRWIRFLPYPVIGGFLAGTGWLLAEGALSVMVGNTLESDPLGVLFRSGPLWSWLSGVLYGVLLLAAISRFRQFWVLPALLLAGILAAHVVRGVSGVSLAEASAAGWFLEPIRTAGATLPWNAAWLSQVKWGSLPGQAGNLAALIGVVSINVLLDATGTEIAAGRDADLDRELRINGLANLLSGLAGGLFGYFSMCFSLLNEKAGGTRRLSGLVAAGLCALVLWKGGGLLILLPKSVLGGLLFYLGLELLLTWAILSWFRLSRLDYALVITILVVVATVNFLAGMAVGILIACLLFVVNSSRIEVVKYTLTGREQTSSFSRSRREQELLEQRAGEILMLCLQSYIFFGTAHSLYETVRRLLGSSRDPVRFLILDFRLVSRLDSSAALSFAKIHQLARQRDVALVCCGMTAPIEHVLREGGCLDGAEDPAVVSPDLDHGIEWCENRILRREGGQPVTHHPIAEQLHDLLAGAADVQAFIRYFELLEVPAHHCLFRQGDEPTNLYFLESGQVTVWLELPGEHNPTRLRTMGAGSVIGEMGLFTGEPRSASVITDQPTRLHGLSLASLQAMRQRSPHLADAFQGFLIRTLAERLTHCERKLQALLL